MPFFRRQCPVSVPWKKAGGGKMPPNMPPQVEGWEPPAGADGWQAGEPGMSSAARAGAARQPGRAGATPPKDGILHNENYPGGSRTADRLRIIPRYVTWRPLTGGYPALAGARRGQDRATVAASKARATDGVVCHEGRSGAAVAVREGLAMAREGEPGAQPPAVGQVGTA